MRDKSVFCNFLALLMSLFVGEELKKSSEIEGRLRLEEDLLDEEVELENEAEEILERRESPRSVALSLGLTARELLLESNFFSRLAAGINSGGSADDMDVNVVTVGELSTSIVSSSIINPSSFEGRMGGYELEISFSILTASSVSLLYRVELGGEEEEEG